MVDPSGDFSIPKYAVSFVTLLGPGHLICILSFGSAWIAALFLHQIKAQSMFTRTPKTMVVIGLIVGLVAAGQFIQCKSTKASKRNEADMSGKPGEFDDAIE